MKKIHILESQMLNENNWAFEAGTDHPYFEDEKTGQSYEANWNGDYGFPFGYWPEIYNGNDVFSIGDAYTTHENACGKMAKRYFYNVKKEIMEEEITYFTDALEDLDNDFKTYGYTYNEDIDMYVSSDGSDEIDLDEWVDDNRYSLDSDKAKEIAEDVINGGSIPYADDLAEEIASNEAEYYDFTDREGIDQALEEIGSNFNSYFESGRNEGRIWPQLGMIGFYATEQPDPQTLTEIMRDLASTGIVTYEDLLQYNMVFEDWRNDGQITACTLSDYIDGNYGPDSYEDEEDNDEEENEIQYARDGKTQFVPHLANQDQKREFFRDFRNTRDQAVYVPREKGAGSLARYHAMRYPYGENKMRQDSIITEVVNQYLLKEAYLGDLYHMTTLSHLYSILATNCIYRTVDDYGHKDSRMGNDVNVVCLTRNKNFQYKTNNLVRITLDGELMSSSLRNAKIHPYNYYEEDEEPNFNAQESEERVYKSDIYPLNKYCKSIDVYVRDINMCDYYFCDDIDYAYEGLAKMGNNDPSDRDINLWFLKHITEDFPSFSHLIHIHGYDTMNEN